MAHMETLTEQNGPRGGTQKGIFSFQVMYNVLCASEAVFLFSVNALTEHQSVCGNRRYSNLAQVTHCTCETMNTSEQTHRGGDREQSAMSRQVLLCSELERRKKGVSQVWSTVQASNVDAGEKISNSPVSVRLKPWSKQSTDCHLGALH